MSLIEMLVGLAIVALLSGLVISFVKKASQKAKSVACLQNMRQLTMSLLQYAQENSERPGFLPYTYDYFSNPDVPVYWAEKLRDAGLLEPSALNGSSQAGSSILFCPASTVRWNGKCDWLRGHYALNTTLAGSRNAKGGYPFQSISLRALDTPSRTILLLDGGAYALGWFQVNNPSYAVWYFPGDKNNASVSWREENKQDALQGRHGDKLHISFVDGHIEARTVEDTKIKSEWMPNQ